MAFPWKGKGNLWGGFSHWKSHYWNVFVAFWHTSFVLITKTSYSKTINIFNQLLISEKHNSSTFLYQQTPSGFLTMSGTSTSRIPNAKILTQNKTDYENYKSPSGSILIESFTIHIVKSSIFTAFLNFGRDSIMWNFESGSSRRTTPNKVDFWPHPLDLPMKKIPIILNRMH